MTSRTGRAATHSRRRGLPPLFASSYFVAARFWAGADGEAPAGCRYHLTRSCTPTAFVPSAEPV